MHTHVRRIWTRRNFFKSAPIALCRPEKKTFGNAPSSMVLMRTMTSTALSTKQRNKTVPSAAKCNLVYGFGRDGSHERRRRRCQPHSLQSAKDHRIPIKMLQGDEKFGSACVAGGCLDCVRSTSKSFHEHWRHIQNAKQWLNPVHERINGTRHGRSRLGELGENSANIVDANPTAFIPFQINYCSKQ